MAAIQTNAELLETLNSMLDSDDEVQDKTAKHAKETKATSKAALTPEQVAEKRLAAQRQAKRNKTALKKLAIALKARGLNMDEFIAEEDSFTETVDKAINDMVKAESLVDDRDIMLVNTRIFPEKIPTSEFLQSFFAFLTGAETSQADAKSLQQAEDKKKSEQADDMVVTTGEVKKDGAKKRKAPQSKKQGKEQKGESLPTEQAGPAQPLPPSDPRPLTPAPDQAPAKTEQHQQQEKAHAKAKKPRAKKQTVVKQEVEGDEDVVMTDA